jgi:hypothetical protein
MEILSKKRQHECDLIFREITFHSNAIASIYLIKHDYSKALELYKQIISSEEEYNSNFRLDLLQKVHALYNYSQTLIIAKANKPDEYATKKNDILIEEINKKLEECEKQYLSGKREDKQKAELKLKLKTKEIKKLIKKTGSADAKSTCWLNILENYIENSKSKSNDFWDRLNAEFSTTTDDNILLSSTVLAKQNSTLSYVVCGKNVTSIAELKYTLVTELDKIDSSRDLVLDEIAKFYEENENYTTESKLVKKASECHLRNEFFKGDSNISNKKNRTNLCEVCKCEQALDVYYKNLFTNCVDDNKPNFTSISNIEQQDVENKTDTESEDEEKNKTKATTSLETLVANSNEPIVASDWIKRRNDIEKFLKVLISFVRNEEGE